MPRRKIQAHYDGVQVLLDENVDLRPNTRLIVTVLADFDEDRNAFLNLSSQSLAEAYSEGEVEYTEANIDGSK
jgi:hypothetical protein